MPGKTTAILDSRTTSLCSFNEAPAKCRGKLNLTSPWYFTAPSASMRPQRNAGENGSVQHLSFLDREASMRPQRNAGENG